ncbi:MAG: butyrate kinase [Sphaerochaetaceae bacterium]|nr:butyrate kinase [Sphaerochaetaceae bacterium]
MMSDKKIVVLAINPGSTTTKLALFEDGAEVALQNHDHSVEELARLGAVYAQFTLRRDLVIQFLETNHVQPGNLGIVMGRGGLLHPLASGVYRVNNRMLHDLQNCRYGEHACNLGAPLADAIAKRYSCEAMIADPVVVDEMIDEARISGMPEIERRSIFHALNQKYVARLASIQLGRSYEETRLIVAHLGGGISVGSHRYGKVIDVNNALDGEGPFTPERSGGLPVGDLIKLVLSGIYSHAELKKKVVGSGGLFAYTGSRDVKKLVEADGQGDKDAQFWLRALVYQISKEISAHFSVLEGRIDAVVLTGGIAHNDRLMGMITERLGNLVPVIIIPGEGEMHSLAENAYAVLNRTREVMEYE